ncbi:MAG: class I SAM-dependent rRNA methyltransferase [Erysipelotrichaceae bacterium]|nr:class I SAM-dependent rRNA methyltransferase [Erysipelotrichaceae bacterium]
MKTNREFPCITITAKGEDFLAQGNNWVYENEILDIDREHENGDIVDVVSKKGKYLGTGFISDLSKIRVRIFSKNTNDVYNDDFFKRRVKYAIDYRVSVMDNISNCRIIFGEADGFPGLTVDKYNDILVTQITTIGIERRKDIIFSALLEQFKEYGKEISAIFERNDVNSRSLDGLELYKSYYYAKDGFNTDRFETIIEENGIKYYVDYVNGQKTGYFLDQKFNRDLAGKLARNKTVLDCFTHTGSFGLNCAKNGAKKVVSVDVSPLAIEQSKRNAKLNGLDDIVEYVKADVFDYLDKEVKKRQYDMIILDPPAFTKSRSTIMAAFNGYKRINSRAMQLLGKGGYLVTCSCSHFMNEDLFVKMLLEAANENNVTLKQISYTQQGKDHPILLSSNQTDYLKFYMFQIM